MMVVDPAQPEQQLSLDQHTQSKLRKIRKGAHSCWECKRRKMRCIFAPVDAATCNACRRRGSQCVSQAFPQSVARGLSTAMASTLAQDDCANETGIAQHIATLTRHGEDGASTAKLSDDVPNAKSMASDSVPDADGSFPGGLASYETESAPSPGAAQGAHHPYESSNDMELSRVLHASLPSRQDIDRICTGNKSSSVLAHETMTTPFTLLEQRGLATAESLAEPPKANAHPVVIARYLLLVATLLQSQEIKHLSESERAVMERLVELAASRVTRNDRFMGSIEVLECLMIESAYHANIGNLRRSWLAVQRAMSVAQLMGLNRARGQAQYEILGATTHCDPHIMWFRIVDLDRYLCLMLGLPQGSLDRSMASDAVLENDTPLGRIERIHCAIASRILERNDSTSSSHDPTLTRTLDVELQRAARRLPSKWWLVPDLRLSSNPQALFWDTRRLFAQVLHYNLLNQLHLPYMLRSSSANRKHEYSLMACVNASREMLSRFITLRSFNGVAYSCRTIDFIALMAAMTLLLAHLDSHGSETENLLAHQYHSDRAMIELVKENMQELNRVRSDALSAQIAGWLARLLAIEAEAAEDGQSRCARTVSVQKAGFDVPLHLEEGVHANGAVIVQLPYFGILKIARNGLSKDMHIQQHRAQGDRDSTTTASVGAVIPLNSAYSGVGDPGTSESDCYSAIHSGLLETMLPSVSGFNNLHRTQQGLVQHPDTAPVGEHWAFEGVDWAFFENLTRRAETDACDPDDAERTMA